MMPLPAVASSASCCRGLKEAAETSPAKYKGMARSVKNDDQSLIVERVVDVEVWKG